MSILLSKKSHFFFAVASYEPMFYNVVVYLPVAASVFFIPCFLVIISLWSRLFQWLLEQAQR